MIVYTSKYFEIHRDGDEFKVFLTRGYPMALKTSDSYEDCLDFVFEGQKQWRVE